MTKRQKGAVLCAFVAVASFATSYGFALLTHWSGEQGGWFWKATGLYSFALAMFFAAGSMFAIGGAIFNLDEGA
jgi:hypothetical protein